MKKTLTAILACLTLTALITGCGNQNGNGSTSGTTAESVQTTLSSAEILEDITSGMNFANHIELEDDVLKDYYGIDASVLEDYCVKLPMMSTQITEVGVFKVKDAKDIDSVVAGINQRASDVGISLYPSLEQTYESRVVETKGNYVIFAIADNAADIQNKFNEIVK